MREPLVSIVTPSLNQGAYIEHTIRSVLEQDYPHIEHLVMDGGSTDGTVAILRRYDDRLAGWVSEPDGGQTQAINKGFRRAKGDILAYINSDDWYEPGAVRAAVDCLAHTEAAWCVGEAGHVHADGGEVERWVPAPPPDEGERWRVPVGPYAVPQIGCFWRRPLFERLGWFREDMQYAFDTEFQVRCWMHGFPHARLNRHIGTRLLHEACKTVTAQASFIREQLRFEPLFLDRIPEKRRRAYRFCFAWKRFFLGRRIGDSGMWIRAAMDLLFRYPDRSFRALLRRLGGNREPA